MKREFLEQLGLEKEQIDKVLDAHMKEIGEEKAKRTKAEENADALTKQLNDSQKALSDIQKDTADAESLKAKVAELQEQIKADSEAHAKEMHDKDISFAVDNAIRNAGGLNTKAIKALLENTDSFDFAEDGTVKGLGDQLTHLAEAEDSRMLFKQDTPPKLVGMTPASGTDETPSDTDNFLSAAMRGAGLGGTKND